MTIHTPSHSQSPNFSIPELKLLGVVEDVLAQHPVFGDTSYIFEQLQNCYTRRLTKVSARLPSALKLLEAFKSFEGYLRDHITGNTVLRCAIQHALASIEGNIEGGMPLEECDAIFEMVTQNLKTDTFHDISTNLRRLGPAHYHGWIWDEEYPSNVLGRSFRHLINQNYKEGLCTLSAVEIENLSKGEELLRLLVPKLAPSALSHAHFVGFFSDDGPWKNKSSSSQFRIAGTIFINRKLLRSPWIIAEHLLHESLHQKLYDLRHTHSLLIRGIESQQDGARVWSPWNAEENANRWDTHRTLAAFHVYVHLSLLSKISELRAEELEGTYGPIREMIESKKAIERARYLGEQLKNTCWQELGLSGKRFVNWLFEILEVLNPTPPPPGAYFHHILDLYRREANHINTLDHFSLPTIVHELSILAKEEINSARFILSQVASENQVSKLNADIEDYTEDEIGSKYLEIRKIIYLALMKASPNGYGLKPNHAELVDANALVKDMALKASQGLYSLINRLPKAVVIARSRARELQFKISCDDRVGRLLAVFAAAVPSGGRILEIGTGVGVGTAWISSGLHEKTDIEVVSVEVDFELSHATSNWSWSPNIKFIAADALEVLRSPGGFDLIFADASPIKYGHIESVINALCPKGVLIIDDLGANPEATVSQREKIEGLRNSLLYHPKLRAVDLDWASGVVIATRTSTNENSEL
ncbi:hypothetical protein PS943_00924 [Pseudomonas fluorescens]|uniref:Methyltransferase domain-containing protein n=1 Tax=Pseudomonas fluorescens TaxID=294 RepID=A0A5E7W072_PSEFL|nr:HEXXH motif-containing putative peptide modification protein [Pseudomonas fluorescens]VVQ28488.1 hypothetical protein PS943_00924 [Pseudomonas fluorescens]